VKSANADRRKAIEMRQQAMETMPESKKRQAETNEEVKEGRRAQDQELTSCLG